MSERSGSDRVIPFSVEIIPGDVDLFPILLGDLDSLRIGILIESTLNRESLKRGGGGDQIDDHLVTDQGAPPPVHTDEGKHPMFDLNGMDPPLFFRQRPQVGQNGNVHYHSTGITRRVRHEDYNSGN